MKRRILFWLLGSLLLSSSAHAQLQRGTGFFGGTIGFGGTHGKYATGSDIRQNQFSISPGIQFGKFYKENQMFGVALNVVQTFQWGVYNREGQEYRSRQGQYTLSPFLRHYKPIGSRFAMFLQSYARGTLLHNTSKFVGQKDSSTGMLVGIGVLPGVTYWVSKRFALEADVNVLALDVSYTALDGDKLFNFSSVANTNLNSYFALRASWYLQK